MTIARIHDGRAWCDWYQDAKLFKEAFPLAMLRHADDDFGLGAAAPHSG